MEFFSGMVIGTVLTVIGSFAFGFYKKSEKKDDLLANEMGKEFQEGVFLFGKKNSKEAEK